MNLFAKQKQRHRCREQTWIHGGYGMNWEIWIDIYTHHWVFFSFFYCLLDFFFFYVDHYLNSLLNLLQCCFCFMFCFLAERHVGF